MTTAGGVGARAARTLFIGNSLSYYNDGVYAHIAGLAASATPPIAFAEGHVVQGGASLGTHWERGEALAEIRRGGYDAVVLQDDIPETTIERFRDYGGRFVAAAKGAGARPVLFMAWSYERLGWIDQEGIAEAHLELGRELGVEVSPVGLAWRAALRTRPGLDLFKRDREHPNAAGTYLAACALFSTLFGQSPIGLPYASCGPADARFLQEVAWETAGNGGHRERP